MGCKLQIFHQGSNISPPAFVSNPQPAGTSSEAQGVSCNNAVERQNITRSMAMSDFAAPITRARNGGLLEGKEAQEQELAAQGAPPRHLRPRSYPLLEVECFLCSRFKCISSNAESF